MGHADAMLTGMTRPVGQTLREVKRVRDPAAGRTPFGIHVLVTKDKTVFLADTTVKERPTAQELADIAEGTVAVARRMGHDPRVAFLSYSNFGNPPGGFLENVRDAVKVLEDREVDFEFEREMTADAAQIGRAHV